MAADAKTIAERLEALTAKLRPVIAEAKQETKELDEALYDLTGANGGDPVRRALWSFEEEVDRALSSLEIALERERQEPSEALAEA